MNVVFHRTTTEQLIQRCQSACTQFNRYILSGILLMILCNTIARNLFISFSSKKLYIGYIVTFQRNIELNFEYILGSYNILE